ncbi:hypothetical protein AMJ40_02740 [candidate division TA06 bacterium DG_26]|uniref:Uncharacterized protein n=1 Tax=candidate division TA06 bacterium DG_26 TaxID=1703771 RepID=A0A0S7WKV5_UNCT6|nr:MAG: hypothetical protein AMJ40_02740 [candidate division TA06 bacterium DG_26]
MKRVGIALVITICFLNAAERSASEFLFTKVIDGIPYVVVNDQQILQRAQASLLHSLLIGPTYQRGPIVFVDTAHPEVNEKLGLYWEPGDYRLWPIVGPEGNMKYWVGYKPGDCFTMQEVTDDGSGQQCDITVDKVFYSVWGRKSAIVLKCEPVPLDSTSISREHRTFYCPYITYPCTRWIPTTPRGPIDIEIPDTIARKVHSLSSTFFPADILHESVRTTVKPLRLHRKSGDRLYYAVVLSYGEKGVTGVLYLLDASGGVIQRLSDRYFSQIMGITDTNRDGTHELIVFIGGAYGGGMLIYLLEWDDKKELAKLSSATYIDTVFD